MKMVLGRLGSSTLEEINLHNSTTQRFRLRPVPSNKYSIQASIYLPGVRILANVFNAVSGILET
ncbi:unnamed protein product [Orchesella dallaii]|uniref:Uncharacterized protein n=1 Tax=Orchesella dallaii TaxID=48710 RepID=A0ABP1RUW9_9HEXA